MTRSEYWKQVMDEFYAKHPDVKTAIETMGDCAESIRIAREAYDILHPTSVILTSDSSNKMVVL
jgi:hypothetical protein